MGTPYTLFGARVRALRAARKADGYSLRRVAGRLGIEPSYLSKIELGTQLPSDELLLALAKELGEDPDVLMLLAGRLPDSLVREVRKRPQLFADVLRQLKKMPDDAILRLVREVRDGDW